MDIIKVVFLKQLGIIKDFKFINNGTDIEVEFSQPIASLNLEFSITKNDIKIKKLNEDKDAG